MKPKKELVAKTGIKREPNWVYFVDKEGDISRARMARGKKSIKNKKKEKVKKVGVKLDNRYFYFVDKIGNISRAAMPQKRYMKKPK